MTTTVSLPNVDFEALSDLKSRMSAFTTRFDHFIAAGRDQLRRERNDFTAGMAEDRLAQRSIQQSIEQTKQEHVALEARLHREMLEVQEMQHSIDEYKTKKGGMEDTKASLEQQISTVRESMTKRRGVMSAKRQELAAQNIKNRPELNAWVTQLGLQIDSAGTDMLRFTFTMINSRDADMPHFFTINVSTSTYAVEECHPALASMQDCVNELNKTRNFSVFLKTVRKDFKALY